MFKFIKKRVSLGGGTKGKSDLDGKDVTAPPQQLKFEISDQNASRLSDLFEVAVRTKLSDRSSDPLAMAEDDTTEHLVEEFLQKKTAKADYENYSANTLWSAGIAILSMEDRILSSEACEAIKSATSEGITKLAGDLPLPAQKLLGIVFAAAEMLIRDEPHCAPMVLNVLSKTLLWALPPSTYVATNALVNLAVDHRRLFPSCHTFARKISSTVSPVSAGEWRAFCASSVAVYGQPGSAADVTTGPVLMTAAGENGSAAAASAGVGAGATGTGKGAGTAGGDTNSEHSGEDASYVTAPSVSEVQGPGSRWRVSYTSDLPLNDVNASASIDVSALRRTAQAPQEESKRGVDASRGAGIATSSARAEAKSGGRGGSSTAGEVQGAGTGGDAGAGGGRLSIRDLQGVFSSSLVSSASLDYLSIASIMDDDYADIRTLSGAIKWILQSQQLSDAVGAQKGIVSWREFLAIAQPFLAAADVEYLRSPAGAKVAYDAAVPDFSAARAEAKGAGGGGWQQAGSKALLSSKSRSRKGFGGAESDASTDEDEDREEAKNSRALAKRGASEAPAAKQAAPSREEGGGKAAGAGHWSRNRTAVARDEPEEPEATLSDVDELDLSNGGISPLARDAQAASSRGPALNKNIKARRNDWDEDSEGSDEDGISITSGSQNKARHVQAGVGRKADAPKGPAGASRVFDLDLLDDAVSAAPQKASTAGNPVGAAAKQQPGLGERDLHNSFDDEEEEVGSSGAADTEEEEETPLPDGRATFAGARAAPPAASTAAAAAARREHAATASFMSDTDSSSGLYRLSAGTADAASRAQRDSSASVRAVDAAPRSSVGTGDAGLQAGTASMADTHPDSQPADVSALDVSRLTTTSAAGSEISATDQSAIKQKSALKKAAKGAKNFFKGVFSLTSTSSNNSQASGSVSNASPARSRLNSTDSNDPSAATVTGSADGESRTQDNTRRNSEPAAAEHGSGGVFARMKARFSRGRSDSRDSAGGIPDAVGDSGSVGSPSSPQTPTPVPEPEATAAAEPTASNPPSAANSAKYSVGIAEAADTGLTQGADPPRAATGPAGDGALPAGRMQRSDSTASAGSVASSTHTAGTGASMGSTASGRKKRAPSLKGMVHKSYKVMFGAGGKKASDAAPAASPSPVLPDSPAETPGESGQPSPTAATSSGENAGTGPAMSPGDTAATPAPAPVPVSTQRPSATLVPPPKPQRQPAPPSTATTAGGESPMAAPDKNPAPVLPKSESPVKPPKPTPLLAPGAASVPAPVSEHKPSSPAKPPKRPSTAAAAQHATADGSEGTPLDDAPHAAAAAAASQAEHKHAVRHAPGPPSTPSIYQPLPAPTADPNTHTPPAPPSLAAPHASEPAPGVPSTTLPPLAHTPSAPDLSSAASDGTITAERKLSNPALKRSSFKLSSLFAFGGSKTSSRNSSRVPSRSNSFSGEPEPVASPGPVRSDSSLSDAPLRQVPSNGTGLAALLRGNTQPAPSSSTAKAGPTRQDSSTAYTPDRSVLDRCADVLERSRLRTAALHAKLSQQPAAQSTALSVPVDIMGDMERIRAGKRQHGSKSAAEGAEALSQKDWQQLLARREPKCLRLSTEERRELRAAAERNLDGKASQQEKEREAQGRKEEALHLLLQKQLSRVPDPLFGLSLHQRGSAASSRPLSARLSSGEMERLVAQDVMHSELDLALGVKFAGHLSRVASRFWRKRYFVLVVEPLINPNLHLLQATEMGISGVQKPQHSADTPSDALEATAPTVAEEPALVTAHPRKLAYFLLEYARCVDSKWGHCPVQLLRRYAIEDVLALRTDSKASKHGLEFTVILRRPDLPDAANKQNAAPSVPAAGADGTLNKDLSKPGHDNKAGNKFASLVLQSKTASATTTGSPPLSADLHRTHHPLPSVDTAAGGNGAAPAGSVANSGPAAAADPSAAPSVSAEAVEEEEPVVRTRWNRLLKKSQSAGAPSSTVPAADAPSTAVATDGAAPPVTAAGGIDGQHQGDVTQRARASSIANPGPLVLEAEQQGGDDGASEAAGDAQSEAGTGEEEDGMSDAEGDFAFLAAAGAAGRGAGGEQLSRKQLRKLKLRAHTPDDRLQWVQILLSVAGHALHSNNTSY